MLSWAIGDIRVSVIVESAHAFPCEMLLPQCTLEEVRSVEWLGPPFVTEDGMLPLSVQAFVVEADGRRIVVDTCMGNDKPRAGGAGNMMQTDFLERFEAAGFPRDSIDIVLCTHLHIDHVGWNTMLKDGRWVPTFPKARYLIGRTEFEFWRGRTEGDDAAIFADSIQPLFDSECVDLVEVDHVLCEGVRLVSSPGHTPGHVSVAITSGERRALIGGDILHNPVQAARPDWGIFVDNDPAEAEKTRRAVLEELADEPILLIGTHFPAPTAGTICRDGCAYRFVP